LVIFAKAARDGILKSMRGSPPLAIFLLCVASALCQASISSVQTVAKTSGPASSLSLSFPTNTVAGDLILVAFDYSTNAIPASVTDSQGNVFTSVGNQLTSPGGVRSRVYYANNIAGGADTVTVNLSANSSWIDLYLTEYTGVSQTNPIDAQAGASGNGGAVSSGNATTAVAGDLIYGYCVGEWACTVGSGFTARSTWGSNLIEDKQAGNAGTYAATGWANKGWTMQMVALKPASSVMGAAPAIYPLTVSVTGTGSGSVSSNPSSVNCPGNCGASFNSSTSVTLTAVPGPGSTFAGWGGACSGTGGCTVAMNTAESVTATFNLISFQLSVILGGTGNGSVSSNPAGLSCAGICYSNFNSGTLVTLTATPASGSTFAGWSGACVGTGSCSVNVSAAKSVTATFNLNPTSFSLSVNLSGTGSGTVTISPAGSSCPGNCTVFFNSGTSVTLTAVPATGSMFAGWSGACNGAAGCTVIMNTAEAVTATFNVVSSHIVDLSWNASTNAIGYNVYRAPAPAGPYSRLNSGLVAATLFTDSIVTSGTTYYYVTTAVDNTGLESGYSNVTEAIVPYP